MSFMSMSKIVLPFSLHKPATRRYPFEKREPFPATRGHIAIDVDACILCGLCQKRCPSDAIVVDKPNKSWIIDRLRCVQCNACVEVCPKKCLVMERTYSPSVTAKSVDSFVQGQQKQKA